MAAYELTKRDIGIGLALEIQRKHDPKDWRKHVDAIQDDEARAVADGYLRDIVRRINAVRKLKLVADNRRP